MYSDVLLKLEQNPNEIYEKSTRILLKIAENILKSPENKKIRTLQLGNETISKNILNVPGALECLQLMGFNKGLTTLQLPMNDSLKNLQLVKNEIMKRKSLPNATPSSSNTSKRIKTENEVFKRVVLAPLVHIFNNAFLNTMEDRFHRVLKHEDKDLQVRAINLLPLKQLETNAQTKLRILQEDVKKNKSKSAEECDIGIQDLMILELLKWFKYEFFEWVDCLDCEKCGGKSENAGKSEDGDLLAYADRVEVHKCIECGHLTHFPRFSDLNILLESRRGRCGEWANTFMLFCRALGWDARFVYDEHDHVWTEVYSFGQRRWLHCDPCEATCDTPLIYETGWGKEITYVTAYSCEEVQDVTWRYTNQHSDTLSRRNKCSEDALIDAIMKMRQLRQKSLTQSRRIYLAKRCLAELAEMMVEKESSEKDNQGRSSGSLSWRLSRSEAKEVEAASSYVWSFTTDHVKSKKVTLKYSASSDRYETAGEVKRSWQCGVFESEGIFRNEEKDWKMVYICNKAGSTNGFITWKFEIADESYVFDEVDINLGYKLFEEGEICVKLASEGQKIVVEPNELSEHLKVFHGDRWFTLTVSLAGGKSWQHAQLFRQAMDDEDDFPFSIEFTFKQK